MSDLENWARQLPLADYEKLKAAWRRLLKACGGPEVASKITRARNHSLLSEYGSPSCLDRFPPLDVIADLEAECGEPMVSQALADLMGCDLIRRDARPAGSLRSLMAACTRGFADVSVTFVDSDEDGKWTAKECDELDGDLLGLIEAAQKLRQAVAMRRGLRAVS